MKLNSRQIDLWFAAYGDFADEAVVGRLSRLLDAEERARRDRFRFERDRRSYAVSHGLLRYVLSSYVDCEPADWRYLVGSHGKPTIDSPQQHAGIRFNLSHTRGAMLVGVAAAGELGVDVEFVGRDSPYEELADRYFSPAEVAALRALPPESRRRRFFKLWTLKEAYIKARGLGLAIPLEQFSFSREEVVSSPAWSIAFTPPLVDDPLLWRIAERKIDADFQAAVAVKRSEIGELDFVWRRLRPDAASPAFSTVEF